MNILAYTSGIPSQVDDKFAKVTDTYVQGDVDTFRTNLKGADIRNDEHPYPIWIKDSDLQSVVHCTTGNIPYKIQNTQADNGSIIHGASLDNVVLKEFSTIDKTNAKGSTLGALVYVMSDQELNNQEIKNGELRIDNENFHLKRNLTESQIQEGIERRQSHQEQYNGLLERYSKENIEDGFVHPYSMFIESSASLRNFIAQRSAVINSSIDYGTNVQEGCVLDCVDTGRYNIFAHNSIARDVQMENNNFLMFNALAEHAKLGNYAILLPNTTVEGSKKNPIELDSGLYFGHITSQGHAEKHRIKFEELSRTKSGKQFYHNLLHRMHHILELNGGLPNADGHAQNHNKLTFEEI